MKIATVGDNCIDSYADIGKAFPGGNPVNVAVYSVRLGAQASYTGAVGNDRNGQILLKALSSKGVDVSHVRTLPGSTAMTHVSLRNGERVFGDYDEGVLASWKLKDEEIEFLREHDIVVSGLWGKIEHDLGRIGAGGPPIAFDFATKLDDPVLAIALPRVDYAFFAYDGTDERFIKTFLADAVAAGPRLAIVTLGEKGSLAYDGTSYTSYGIVPVEVVDTMGAGDSYIAGFLKGILEGSPLRDCMAKGAENASVTLRYNGAW